MKRLTIDLKKSYDDYYLENSDTVYTRGEKPKSEYVSPYKESVYLPINDSRNITKRDCYNKLGKLEDIEEEIGIDLNTLFKALKNGVYWKGSGIFTPKKIGIYFEEKPQLDIENKMLRHILYQANIDNVKLKDYGKTWALTEEELL